MCSASLNGSNTSSMLELDRLKSNFDFLSQDTFKSSKFGNEI